jgi:type II secretory pathway pseudopilin PulG
VHRGFDPDQVMPYSIRNEGMEMHGQLKSGDEQGYSLIEILVAVAIMMMLLGGISTLLVEGQRISAGQTDIIRMHQSVRTAIDLMSSEILMAGYDPTNPNYPFIRRAPILEPSATTLRIIADLNNDGDAADANENVFYEWDSSTNEITRDTGSGGVVIARNISACTFTFNPAATTLSSGAVSGGTSLPVVSAAGLQIGDSIYVADTANSENKFISGILGNNIAVRPPLVNDYSAGSTVARVNEITLAITGQTEEENPQTDSFQNIDLTTSITIRNTGI